MKYFCASICRPDFKFKDHLRDESSYEEQPKRQILKRESASFEEVIYLLVAVLQRTTDIFPASFIKRTHLFLLFLGTQPFKRG